MKHVTDLLAARGCAGTTTNANGPVWPQLLPPEMLIGLKMNINRPFGNGRDYDRALVTISSMRGVTGADQPTPAKLKLISLHGLASIRWSQ